MYTDKDAERSFRQSTASKRPKVEEKAIFGLHKPEAYKVDYREPEPWKTGDPLGRLFMNGRARHSEPLVDRRPREILPGIRSFDTNVLLFLRGVADECDKQFKVDVDAEGFTKTGVHTTFGKLKSPAGYLQNPMSAKTVDNTLLREELGLLPGYTKRQREIAVLLWKQVWSQATPASVNVPKASAGGMPRFSHSPQWKLDYLYWKTQPGTYDSFLRAVEAEDVERLHNEFEVVYGMYVQKRLQLDNVGKVRLANDWKYAITGGRSGRRFETDKQVVIDGVDWPDFSASRVRVIDAGPWTINCDLQMVASSHLRSLFKRWPSTFHVNTPEDIASVTERRYIFCSDVSEYDQSMSRDALSVVFETMREYYPEGVVRSAERLYQAPYFAKPLSLDGKKGQWIADPMDWKFEMNSGNRSGHAFTSLVAKVNKVAETLAILDLIYPVTDRNLEEYLRGTMPMGTVNNGDDEITWAASRADLSKFKTLRSQPHLGHYVVTPEQGQGFSGLLLTRQDERDTNYVPRPKLQTALEKCYVPERDIGGVLRPYWPIGWMDRIDALHSSDIGRAIWDVHNHYYRKHLEPEHGTLSGLLEKGMRSLPPDLHTLSSIEKEVLADPSKLHYKYTSDEVGSRVVSLLTSNVPASYTEQWLRRYYKGTLI